MMSSLSECHLRLSKIEGGKGKTSFVGHCHQSLHGGDASITEEIG